MKFLSYLLLLLCFAACGKKNNNQEPIPVDHSFQPTLTVDTESVYYDLKNALNSQDLSRLKELVEENKEIDLNKILDNGETLLITSIRKDYRDIRNYLIDSKVDLNRPNVNGETPLMVASLMGKIESVHRLLDAKKVDDKNLNIDLQDEEGNTALLWAIKKERADIAKELINNNANINLKDVDGYNAYQLAEKENLSDVIDLLRGLTQAAAGIPDSKAFTDILVSGSIINLSSILANYPEMVKAYERINPLVVVLNNQKTNSTQAMLTLLLQNQASVNGPVDAEITPLIRAIQLNNYLVVAMFLNRGADINLFDQEGKSALIHAVEANNPDIVDLLHNYGMKKKYSTQVNDKNEKFNACDTARSVEKTLSDQEALNKNEKIKDILVCGLRFLPFI